METGVRKYTNYVAVSAREHADGSVELHAAHQKGSGAPFTSEYLSTVMQPKEGPFKADELLMMAAWELRVRRRTEYLDVP